MAVTVPQQVGAPSALIGRPGIRQSHPVTHPADSSQIAPSVDFHGAELPA
ncbi:hypothetical protein ACFFX0_32370 [Citricoccus parietis]|uniref:Uncharacterized protein n=1 Tax=Citricoccus parietis TaxID=592307 RepID=A0ABV5G9K1_9MICC